MSMRSLIKDLLKFRDERNWSQFHTLRNLIVSLNLEAAELLELTQWKSDEEISRLTEDPTSEEALRDECADVLLYLLLIAEKAGFDLTEAAQEMGIAEIAARNYSKKIYSKMGIAGQADLIRLTLRSIAFLR